MGEQKLKPTLPQTDADPGARKQDLEGEQLRFQYSAYPEFLQKIDPAFEDVRFPVLLDVPPEVNFTGEYQIQRFIKSAPVITNQVLMRARGFFDPLDKLEDYDDAFIRIPAPPIVKTYRDDAAFAEQRLSGVNPLTLTLLNKSEARAEVLKRIDDPAHAKKAEAALETGRCFVVDFTGTDPAYMGPALVKDQERGGTSMKFDGKEKRKWLPRPLAFFEWETDNERLMPLAIEVIRAGRVFTPCDTKASRRFMPGFLKHVFKRNCDDWFFAKLCVNTADTTHHEIASHLGRVHFTCEPIAVSTHRQLHKSHPLRLLLDTHTRFHLFNNKSAHDTLLGEGGAIHHLFPGTLVESLSIAHQSVRTWNIQTMGFKNEFALRGVADETVLPHYPYRDDGMLLWDSLQKFVSAYLQHFYPFDNDVKNDNELQAWAAELEAVDGGYVGGFPKQISTVEAFVKLITTIIFQMGPYHSALNFLQKEYEMLCTNMPCASYVDPEVLAKKEVITRKDILQLLPPWGAMSQQFDIMFFLAAYQYDTLGHYEKSFKELYGAGVAEVFEEHPQVVQFIEQFQKDLADVEETINERNATRKVVYNGMLPSRCLNSTSI